MRENNIVIVGSGVSALMLAGMIKKYKNQDATITIIEREEKVGGQFGSIHYGVHGYFDYGMHIYYESGVPEIDSLFTSILPQKEWNILEGNLKDAAGLFYNGRLQLDTPFPDLRKFSDDRLGEYVADLFLNIRDKLKTTLPKSSTAYDILCFHFGKKNR